ncbi:unnamed protein product [Oikopleura dioica]|uniref:peptidylprolyl isomerase n=1 Tax=Oikopleura dioica TaxID=34765 RepID=E4WWF1_OIKDI|nr:unnamed protein product [Oikopleura dioica]
MESGDEEANENFFHEISKKQRFDRLLFTKNFPGANSKERMAHLLEITEEVPGTDGGVRITKESVNERGTGITVGDAVTTEAERMKELWHDYNLLPTAPLVSIHYAMWIGDDLLDKPTDYTYDRGNIETGASETVQIGNGSILAGLEKAILRMTQGSQHFVILSPEWGYGKWGNLPMIPGNATLVFQVYVRFVSYEIEDRFVRMPMRLREKIPLKVILSTCTRLKFEAKKHFEKTSDVRKQVNRNTGEETYKKSGKNTGDFFGAERAGELLDCAANVLERAMCKNLDEENLGEGIFLERAFFRKHFI